ncbi:hypothetical protein Ppa06_57170 [Planomonospora parontospora subsp. parontospora]|uniref:S-adenosyl methyltransferase n=3 Tax=Planomonospora parontospora TaxID=58119 RepID=A0AA37F784_9ACTN|nr:hypothetical protein GCM10010126_58130 [Planomonospora parontospora]GII11919.1 hypothetical protein Ppa06_57170 [Planomonospora parontospora subsp. parontospora]
MVAFQTGLANGPRIATYLLGGKTHFAPDREAAERLRDALPTISAVARADREFTERAIRDAAEDGITQFLDLGCGLPHPRNVHDVAGAVTPGARTVYVDHDELVLVHGRAMLEIPGVTAVVPGDIRDPQSILEQPALRALLDLSQPVTVLLTGVVPFVEDPAAILVNLRGHLAPGSRIVISSACSDLMTDDELTATQKVFAETATPIHPCSSDAIVALFDGLDLLDPGVAKVHRWRPSHDLFFGPCPILGGVATLPAAAHTSREPALGCRSARAGADRPGVAPTGLRPILPAPRQDTPFRAGDLR